MIAPVRLSVCITTRNRADFIEETLENILKQCPNDVEVVVVDGASTDDTVEVVRSVASRHSQLRLLTPAKNSGLDADYDKTVQASQGAYCWLFSDDDLLMDGAIERVLQACVAQPIAIIVDASVHTERFERVISERRLPATGPQRYAAEECESFFRDCGRHLTFIGGVIVRRDFWLSRDRKRYYGSEFIHCGVLFQAPIPGEVIVIREPLVQIRYGVGNWMSRWFEVWLIKWPRLVWSFDWISESARESVQERQPWTRPKNLIVERAFRRYGWKDFKALWALETLGPSMLCGPLFCLMLPESAAYGLLVMKRRVNAALKLVMKTVPHGLT